MCESCVSKHSVNSTCFSCFGVRVSLSSLSRAHSLTCFLWEGSKPITCLPSFLSVSHYQYLSMMDELDERKLINREEWKSFRLVGKYRRGLCHCCCFVSFSSCQQRVFFGGVESEERVVVVVVFFFMPARSFPPPHICPCPYGAALTIAMYLFTKVSMCCSIEQLTQKTRITDTKF